MFVGFAWYLHDSLWLLAVFGACGASMMVSYTRARAEGLGIELSGGVMQRAERILLVCGGTFVAVLYGVEAAPEIIGTVMLILAASSTATAINRWVVAVRELAKRAAEPVIIEEPAPQLQPITQPLPALSASDLRKVRPLEQI
jgi:phosphatidylglycerophosphate synthase